MHPEFRLLRNISTVLEALVVSAAEAEFADPRCSTMKIGLAAENIAIWLGAQAGCDIGIEESQKSYLSRLQWDFRLPAHIARDFHKIRRRRNLAVHELDFKSTSATDELNFLRGIIRWSRNTFPDQLPDILADSPNKTNGLLFEQNDFSKKPQFFPLSENNPADSSLDTGLPSISTCFIFDGNMKSAYISQYGDLWRVPQLYVSDIRASDPSRSLDEEWHDYLNSIGFFTNTIKIGAQYKKPSPDVMLEYLSIGDMIEGTLTNIVAILIEGHGSYPSDIRRAVETSAMSRNGALKYGYTTLDEMLLYDPSFDVATKLQIFYKRQNIFTGGNETSYENLLSNLTTYPVYNFSYCKSAIAAIFLTADVSQDQNGLFAVAGSKMRCIPWKDMLGLRFDDLSLLAITQGLESTFELGRS